MRRLTLLCALLATLAWPLSAAAGQQPPVGLVQNFGPNLKPDCPNPEGIAIDPTGNLYAASFAFKPVANICVVSPDQRIIDRIPISAGSAGRPASLLGELFEPKPGPLCG